MLMDLVDLWMADDALGTGSELFQDALPCEALPEPPLKAEQVPVFQPVPAEAPSDVSEAHTSDIAGTMQPGHQLQQIQVQQQQQQLSPLLPNASPSLRKRATSPQLLTPGDAAAKHKHKRKRSRSSLAIADVVVGGTPASDASPSELSDPIDIRGTTALQVKTMSPVERELVLLKRKLRNRESARRSRQKKQLEVNELARECGKLEGQFRELSSLVTHLRGENQLLRGENQRLRVPAT